MSGAERHLPYWLSSQTPLRLPRGTKFIKVSHCSRLRLSIKDWACCCSQSDERTVRARLQSSFSQKG
jgi:hypothetical protein